MKSFINQSSLMIIILITALSTVNSATFAKRGSDIIDLALGDEVRNLYILSVGIDKYWNSAMGDLRFAKKDAKDLAEEFKKRGEYKFNDVKTVLLTDDNATKDGILSELERLSGEISSNDVFVFTFSGMGGAIEVGNKTDTEFYLLSADSKFKSITETGISTSKLQALFRKIRAKRKLIVLDSCDSAAGFESALTGFVETDELVNELVKDDLIFIGTETKSYDNDKLKNGSVTSIVLEALRGKGDLDEDGEISFEELSAYTHFGGIKYARIHQLDSRTRTFIQGKNFKISATDQKIREIARIKAKEKQATSATDQKVNARGQVPIQEKGKTKSGKSEKQGKDYAILFANQNYLQVGYNGLNNPINDINDIKKELEDRYGFEVIVKKDLTTKEIYKTIDEIESLKLEPFSKERINLNEDQLFFFFAGHGHTDKDNQGFYVGKDSPYPFTDEDSGRFVRMDKLITAIERLPIEHIMVVFDACYAGQIWKPRVQLIEDYGFNQRNNLQKPAEFFAGANYSRNSGPMANFTDGSFGKIFQNDYSKLVYAKEKMNNRTRVVITSGARPVPDASLKEDNTLSDNSPFAEAFLKVLRENGGEDEVVIAPEFIPKIDKLNPKPQTGKLSNTDGDFVFVKKD